MFWLIRYIVKPLVQMHCSGGLICGKGYGPNYFLKECCYINWICYCVSQAALFLITAPGQPKCVHTRVNQKHAVSATLPTTKRFCLVKKPLPESSRGLCTTLPNHTYTYKPTYLKSNITIQAARESFKLANFLIGLSEQFELITFLQLIYLILENVANHV